MDWLDYQMQQLLSNSAVFASCVGLVFICVRALMSAVSEYGRAWYDTFEAKSAIALGLIFAVGGTSRAFAVTLIQLRSKGFDTDWLEQYPVPLFTGLGFVIFAGCLIRIMSRSNREWMVMCTLILVFCIIMAILHGPYRAVL